MVENMLLYCLLLTEMLQQWRNHDERVFRRDFDSKVVKIIFKKCNYIQKGRKKRDQAKNKKID